MGSDTKNIVAMMAGVFFANTFIADPLKNYLRTQDAKSDFDKIDLTKYVGLEKPTAKEFVDKLNAVIAEAIEKRTTDDVNNIKIKILDKEFTVEELQRVAEYVQDNPNQWQFAVNKFLATQQQPTAAR